MSDRKYRSDFLFSKPTFLGGMGSVLNIQGQYYDFNYSESEMGADHRALSNDWGMVGEDINSTLNECKRVKELKKSLQDFLTSNEHDR